MNYESRIIASINVPFPNIPEHRVQLLHHSPSREYQSHRSKWDRDEDPRNLRCQEFHHLQSNPNRSFLAQLTRLLRQIELILISLSGFYFLFWGLWRNRNPASQNNIAGRIPQEYDRIDKIEIELGNGASPAKCFHLGFSLFANRLHGLFNTDLQQDFGQPDFSVLPRSGFKFQMMVCILYLFHSKNKHWHKF